MLLGPQTWACCGREIFTEALLLATDFIIHYLRIFRAKDISIFRACYVPTGKGFACEEKNLTAAVFQFSKAFGPCSGVVLYC